MTNRQHGTRVKYVMDGCRCFECRVANTNQETERQARKRARRPWRIRYVYPSRAWMVCHHETREVAGRHLTRKAARALRDEMNDAAAAKSLVDPLWATPSMDREVRRYLQDLREQGVGIRQLAALLGMSRSRLQEILAGRGRIKHETAKRISKRYVTADSTAAGAVIPADETWRLINEFYAAGWSEAAIASGLGYRTPRLAIRRERVLKQTELRVRALHDATWRARPELRRVCQCPEWQP